MILCRHHSDNGYGLCPHCGDCFDPWWGRIPAMIVASSVGATLVISMVVLMVSRHQHWITPLPGPSRDWPTIPYAPPVVKP